MTEKTSLYEQNYTGDVDNENNEHKGKKKHTRYFETYISKLLKNISPLHGITGNAKQQLNSAICIIAKTIADNAINLTLISKKRTVSEKELGNAIRLIFNKFAEPACLHAEKSVEHFKNGEEEKHSSRQDKAGILFPPSITEKFLRNFGMSKIMVTKNTPIYFAAILEYLTSDILIEACKNASDNDHVRVTIRDLELAIRVDSVRTKIFQKCNLTFVGGGVLPQIHESLLNKKSKKKRTKPVDTKKIHRFRPGTVSLREIRKFQKVSNCLTIAKFPFERLVRDTVSKYQEGMKISKDVFIILQYYIEQFIVDFIRDANFAAIHSSRVKLIPADIDFICKLRKYDELEIEKFKTLDESKLDSQ